MATFAVQRFNLVLLDVMLPGADGWNVCRQLWAHHADGPVIMLSVRSIEAHRVLGLALGADDDLAKPISMLEFGGTRAGLVATREPTARVGFSFACNTRSHCWVWVWFICLMAQQHESNRMKKSGRPLLQHRPDLGLGAAAVGLRRTRRRLATAMRDHRPIGLRARGPQARSSSPRTTAQSDEVRDIANAFAVMTQRLEEQTSHEHKQEKSVAHGLHTPLTALHGHLETLAMPGLAAALTAQACNAVRHRVQGAALAQSNKVRRLSQQRFQLTTRQSSDEVLHRERFNLDEQVSDAVQKLGRHRPSGDATATFTLSGQAPGRLALNGDLHLIKRAFTNLTNLTDNAVRHTHDAAPVRLSLTRNSLQARIAVEGSDPCFPPELTRRLAAGLSVREPPIWRPGGAICGPIDSATGGATGGATGSSIGGAIGGLDLVAWASRQRNVWRFCAAAVCKPCHPNAASAI